MSQKSKKTTAVILAAGKGTRMKSDKAKVLHEINGKPMIGYVVDAAVRAVGNNVVVVVGHQKEAVVESVEGIEGVRFAEQVEQLGTGHAVMCAMSEVSVDTESVIILCGDVPLISAETIETIVAAHEKADSDVTVLAVEVEDPYGYGRIILNGDTSVQKIVEEADASENEKKIRLINSGIYCVEKRFLETALKELKSDNAQHELYLTDIVSIGYSKNKKIESYISSNSDEVTGVNTLKDLEKATALINGRY